MEAKKTVQAIENFKEWLTEGKDYEVLHEGIDYYKVIDDQGNEGAFYKKHFKEKNNMSDSDKPIQYQIGIDTFQRAEANMTKEEILACARFNIDKYNWRKKSQDKEDFEKIIAYAQWALKQL